MPQVLLAYVVSNVSDQEVVALQALVKTLGEAHTWTVGPPEFVDEVDDGSCTRPEDEPVRTLGIALPVSSPGQLPETPVAEAECLLDSLANLSQEGGLELEVQLDETYVGYIKQGHLDPLLRNGLLKEW